MGEELASCGGLGEILGRAEAVVGELGDQLEGVGARLRELKQRFEQGRVHLAVLGQFKRGKSSLLNALIGEEILPTGVMPLTAIPTFISYGPQASARVVFVDETSPPQQLTAPGPKLREFIAQFVSEQANPANRLGVGHVQITYPAPVLARGVVFIDTPGIGSTFRHNTEATLNFLPQCDAAVVVLSADPPITEVEVEFLRMARRRLSRMFFVLNKVDYLSPSDRELAQEFVEKVIREEVGIENMRLWSLSAREALEAKASGQPQRLAASGLPMLEAELMYFAEQEKMATLAQAVRFKAAEAVEQARVQVQLMLRSLNMPLEDLQRRLKIFESKISEIHRQRQSAHDILAGERRRLMQYLEELASELRQQATAHLKEVLSAGLERTMAAAALERKAQELLAEEIPVYFERESARVSAEVGRRTASALKAHARRAAQLVSELTRTAAELFEVSYHELRAEDAFRLKDRPYWVTHGWSSSFLLPEGVIERLLPPAIRRRRTLRRLELQVQELARRNVENLRWSLYQSINESFRTFASDLDNQLNQALEATHGAIREGLKRREEHAEAVAGQLRHLEKALGQLELLARQLQAL